jgi:hypothetical protein
MEFFSKFYSLALSLLGESQQLKNKNTFDPNEKYLHTRLQKYQ